MTVDFDFPKFASALPYKMTNAQKRTIKEAIENGAKTLDDIKDETEAGTICGMCEDEIQEIIDELVK